MGWGDEKWSGDCAVEATELEKEAKRKLLPGGGGVEGGGGGAEAVVVGQRSAIGEEEEVAPTSADSIQ